MAGVRRVVLFILGVYLIIYALTVHPVQIALIITALLLMGVVTWDQLADTIRRNGDDHSTPPSGP